MDPLNALLDSLNEAGSRFRYGMGPTEKYQLMASGTVPGQPKPFLPTGEENPEATRYLSNYLGAKQWGQAPAHAVNLGRYLLDNDTAAYASGVQGEQAAGGNPLQALLMSMGRAGR